ncbi:hypothetical protein M0R45_012586 [Rubus argutus]|uniref:Uncharacterized protein n=1 Tax=Rubus argutus TaxID=59490 RepID=A0AAW1YEP2_RUBAR
MRCSYPGNVASYGPLMQSASAARNCDGIDAARRSFLTFPFDRSLRQITSLAPSRLHSPAASRLHPPPKRHVGGAPPLRMPLQAAQFEPKSKLVCY